MLICLIYLEVGKKKLKALLSFWLPNDIASGLLCFSLITFGVTIRTEDQVLRWSNSHWCQVMESLSGLRIKFWGSQNSHWCQVMESLLGLKVKFWSNQNSHWGQVIGVFLPSLLLQWSFQSQKGQPIMGWWMLRLCVFTSVRVLKLLLLSNRKHTKLFGPTHLLTDFLEIVTRRAGWLLHLRILLRLSGEPKEFGKFENQGEWGGWHTLSFPLIPEGFFTLASSVPDKCISIQT
jgi:hypothetical protein